MTKFECLVTSPRTEREATIYTRLREYINDSLNVCPTIVRAFADNEPFNTVEEFGAECDKGNLVVWAKHFFTDHPTFTGEEYGTWRAVHDYLGHYAWFKATNGRQGHFDLKGEVDAIWAVANDCGDPLVVEGVIIETVARNLVTTPTYYPVANVATEAMAWQYTQARTDTITERYLDIREKPQVNHHLAF